MKPHLRVRPLLILTLVALAACSSTVGPLARPGVNRDSPTGGGYEYGATGAENGNNWTPVNGDAADLRRR